MPCPVGVQSRLNPTYKTWRPFCRDKWMLDSFFPQSHSGIYPFAFSSSSWFLGLVEFDEWCCDRERQAHIQPLQTTVSANYLTVHALFSHTLEARLRKKKGKLCSTWSSFCKLAAAKTLKSAGSGCKVGSGQNKNIFPVMTFWFCLP